MIDSDKQLMIESHKRQFEVMKMIWLSGVIAIVLMQLNIWVSDYKIILREISSLKQQVASLESRFTAEVSP